MNNHFIWDEINERWMYSGDYRPHPNAPTEPPSDDKLISPPVERPNYLRQLPT